MREDALDVFGDIFLVLVFGIQKNQWEYLMLKAS